MSKSKSTKPSKIATEKPDDTRLSRGRTRPEAIFPVAPSTASLPESYAATLQEIKTHLRSARVRAVLAANPLVIEAYWNTGKIILARQQESAWGSKVIDRLAADLQEAFPDMGGLSSRNLLSMKLFAEAFPDGSITKQPVSQLPWGQIIRLIQMVKDPAARDFYIREALAQGWSRNILEIQIQNQLHLRAGKAQNNFALTMPPADSDMAAQLFKDPYLFSKSIAVAAWQTQLTESLPEGLRSSLPTIEEIETELANELPPVKPISRGKSSARKGFHAKTQRRKGGKE